MNEWSQQAQSYGQPCAQYWGQSGRAETQQEALSEEGLTQVLFRVRSVCLWGRKIYSGSEALEVTLLPPAYPPPTHTPN